MGWKAYRTRYSGSPERWLSSTKRRVQEGANFQGSYCNPTGPGLHTTVRLLTMVWGYQKRLPNRRAKNGAISPIGKHRILPLVLRTLTTMLESPAVQQAIEL